MEDARKHATIITVTTTIMEKLALALEVARAMDLILC